MYVEVEVYVSMKTIYLIYLKKSGTLYAYSDIKSIKKRFIRERKKKCFITKKVKMKRSELDEFITKYSKIKLDTLVTRKSNKCYESFVMTTTEKFELIDTAIQLYYKLNAISYDLISRLPIKEKYKKSIK